MKARLKRDIVIPAETIFDDAPRRMEMQPGHVEYILGLTKDSAGMLLYFLDPDDEALTDWFEVLDSTGGAMTSGDSAIYDGWIRRKHYGAA